MGEFGEALDRYFRISERGSTVQTEIKGGIITFLSMVYILVVNPILLAPAAGDSYTFGELFTATGLAAVISCILMGVYARFPVALAPGMGLNLFLSMTICIGLGFTFEQGLMAVLISGIIFFVISVTGLRKAVIDSIPKCLKVSITAGIGFFIAVVGLYNAGIIVHGNGTALALGAITDPGVVLSLFCITLTLVLWQMGRWYAVIVSLAITWVIGIVASHMGLESAVTSLPSLEGVELYSTPDFGLFGAVFSGFEGIGDTMWISFIAAIVSLCVVDLFDTTGTLIGVGSSAGMADEDGNIPGVEKALMVDSVSTVAGAVCGTSTTTSFIESLTGIESGAKTGLMAVVTGIMFAVALFMSGLFASVTSCCTAGALVFVGVMMLRNLGKVDWDDNVGRITAVVTVFMMGLTGSITDGIAFGFFAYVVGALISHKKHEVSLTMWILVAIFLIYFIVQNVIADL